MSLSEQKIIRINKLNEIKILGINPYPSKEYLINNTAENIRKNFINKKKVSIAGRLMRLRILGKASFGEIKDHTGRIQIYLNKDNLYIDNVKKEDVYNVFLKKLLDIGDIIGIKGFLFTTKMNEITINVKELTLLSKSIRPLPQVKISKDKKIYDEFSDVEQRYRMRYVDLIVNDKVKNIFLKRTKIIKKIRNFLDKKGYIEVDTPILQPIPGGAVARPFITYHNSLGIPLYLRIANELYLKRLIVGGFNGVYEFSKNFRNEGMDRYHNPEFTVLELYVAYKDYYWMMNFTEKLITSIFMEFNYKVKHNKIYDPIPFSRISMLDSIKKYTGFDINNMNKSDLIKICIVLKIKYENKWNKCKIIEHIFDEKCKKNYVDPTFIIDYPIEMSPLTKKHREKKNLSERFELIINGQEIANAYSELNDPIDQFYRLKKQIKYKKELKNNNNTFIDEDFIRSLEFGMPPTAGIGIGIDRLIMLLTGNKSIQEVLFFPQMRPKK
ncbi:lysine--tRNA ligase [Blattabacterium cuenoti]|uniref:lysine--tRNA ligase n=1 Tax=Blattabacterium cuenoti TaxID=1653831 RepID=UPI00163BF2EA|nr:lysine--tRNA ligase [Blattabacterium cuenoti]